MKKTMKKWLALWLILSILMPCVAAADTESVPEWAEDGVLRILGVGNSYTEDTFWKMYEVAQAMGIEKVELATMVIGGSTLQRHINYLKRGIAKYTLHRNTNGVWKTTQNASVHDVINTDWDFVTMQEQSISAGLPSSIGNVEKMAANLHELFPRAKVVWNVTWAYPDENDSADFAKYFDRNNVKMYESIISTAQEKVVPVAGVDYIIPNGTAIQNARQTYLGDSGDILFRDKLHLTHEKGRIIVAMNTLATLTGMDVTPMLDKLQDQEYAACAVEAVINAQKNPWQVTSSQYPSEK
ncbi:MAG: DUF4886 domain-containing protein [Clostridiales bacterium]|nr:DUF4886 domain-containing protein [Clostridiales bacterium]